MIKDGHLHNVPALRFPEFSGEWEKEYLGNLYFFQYGEFNRNPDNGGKYPIYGANGIIGGYTRFNAEDSIIIGHMGAYAGTVRYEKRKHFVTYNGTIGKPIDSERINHIFGYYAISNIGIPKICAGSGLPFLSYEMLDKFFLSFPSYAEQKKISDLLSLIDDRIDTQSKIIEEQETLLKSLADSLISSQMANMALNDCVVARSSTIKESELEPSGAFPVYGASGLCGYSSEALEAADSILVTKDGSGVGTCQYVTGAHSFLGTLCSLAARESVYLPYIYYALLNFNFAAYKTGLAIPHIYFKDYGRATIFCPSYDEQFRIASGLERLEAKINIGRELLKQFHLQKEYLLSHMFI